MMPMNKDGVSDEALAEMLAGLEGVTKPGFGRWMHLLGDNIVYTKDPNDGCRTHPLVRDSGGGPDVLKHIARCDPDTIGSIITELQERRARNRRAPAVVTEEDYDEVYEIGKRDGYEEAIQELDTATGGDGEYQVSVLIGGGVNEDRHCPDAASMKARIVGRFAALSVRAEPETRTCETCQGNGELVTDWDRYLHGPLDENGDDAVMECPDCNGEGTVTPVRAEPVAWKPIETAPKDGTPILLGHDQSAFDGWWDVLEAAWVDGTCNSYEELIHFEPTHWQELPSPPAATAQQQEGDDNADR